MKRKKIWTDPGFWLLLGTNIYLVWYYYQTPQLFTTLIWLYWCQSVTMGIFNALDMLTMSAVNSTRQENSALFKYRLLAAALFTFHYGGFHLIYLFFLTTVEPSYPVDWDLFKYFLMAFFVGQVVTFVQHKVEQRNSAGISGTRFLLPYLRILPMHLTVLVPAFLQISNLGLFLILKVIADMVGYVITKPGASARQPGKADLASQHPMN